MDIFTNDRRDESARIRDRMLGRPHIIPYQGYNPDTTDAEARAAFVAKYGAEPEEIVHNAGATLAGPVPQEPANA
jgi:hypothetical protein